MAACGAHFPANDSASQYAARRSTPFAPPLAMSDDTRRFGMVDSVSKMLGNAATHMGNYMPSGWTSAISPILPCEMMNDDEHEARGDCNSSSGGQRITHLSCPAS